jgi:hypothetical protein
MRAGLQLAVRAAAVRQKLLLRLAEYQQLLATPAGPATAAVPADGSSATVSPSVLAG